MEVWNTGGRANRTIERISKTTPLPVGFTHFYVGEFNGLMRLHDLKFNSYWVIKHQSVIFTQVQTRLPNQVDSLL